MADIVDAKTRSRMMRGIRSKDTKPELMVRRYLHAQGYRFRIHPKNVPGKPDVVLPKYRAAIFVHGCFWHRHKNCRLAYNPKSRTEFWQTKFDQNVARDNAAVSRLLETGWRIMIVWECALRDSELRETGLESIAEWIQSGQPQSEFPPSGRLST
jgi:DNA mismatch endonuclease (patch repair protein)